MILISKLGPIVLPYLPALLILAQALLVILRLLLAGIFLLASVSKIRERGEFHETVKSYRLLPSFIIRPFADLLPWVELVLGIALLFGFQYRWAAGLACILYLIFAAAIGVNLHRGRSNLGCGCFGSKDNHKISLWLLGRDGLLALAAALVAVFGGGLLTIDNFSPETKDLLIQISRDNFLPVLLSAIGLFYCYMLFKRTVQLTYLSSKGDPQ